MGKADFKKTDNILNDGASNGKPKKKKPTVKRANHKHVYEPVLLDKVKLSNNNYWSHLVYAKVCTICKRVGEARWAISVKTENGYYRTLENEEVLAMDEYKNLPVLDAEKEGIKCL